MSLAIIVFITWLFIILLSKIPKRLSEHDMIFLFFVNTIFELSIFTLMHLNFNWIVVSHNVEKSIADLVMRLILNPLTFIITTNFLLYPRKFLKWILMGGMLLYFILMERLLEWLGVLTVHHWKPWLSILMFSSYAVFSRLMAWFITNVDRKEVKKV